MTHRVVVTGYGVISPVGNDVETFFSNLLNGKHGIDTITKFDSSQLKVNIAAEVKDFEPTLYMEKSEVKRQDLFTQYAVAAAKQAVEQSGIVGFVKPERFGVYIGSGIGGINTIIDESKKSFEKGVCKPSPFFVPMMILNMAAAKVAINHNAKGPCLPVVTACATSTHAIGEAFRAIKHGYADAIIAGGSEAAVNELSIAGFISAQALHTGNDKDRASIPFDKNRSGFVMGEGAGVLILESLENAQKRGAKILAEISGYSNTCDAYHITAPSPDAAGSIYMMKEAFEESGFSPDADTYINPHGTSTPLNDKTETFAIKSVFGESAYNVPISSTKSMTGHLLGAAGAVEAIAAIKTLETGYVHPNLGLTERDPECDLDIVTEKRKVNVSKAISLSLGFGGHNACLIFNKLEARDI